MVRKISFEGLCSLDNIRELIDDVFVDDPDDILSKNMLYALMAYLHLRAEEREQSRVMLKLLLRDLWNKNYYLDIGRLLKGGISKGFPEIIYNEFQKSIVDFETSKKCAYKCVDFLADITLQEYSDYIFDCIKDCPNKNDMPVYVWRAEKYYFSKQFDLALQDIEVVLSFRNLDDYSFNFKGILLDELYGAQSAKEQIEMFSKAIELKPQEKEYYYNRGKTYLYDLHDYEKAKLDFYAIDGVLELRGEADKILKDIEELKTT